MSSIPSPRFQTLRCLKCQKYLSYFPIYQRFHPQGSICGRCPIETGLERNVIYEEVALVQKFPCCYDENGCLENLYPTEVPIHEEICRFRTYDCPFNGSIKCNWTGVVKNLWDHFKVRHAIYTIQSNRFQVDLVGNYNENYLLNFEEELYIVNQSNSKGNIFSCNVFYLGSNTNARNYIYKITFQNASKEEIEYVVCKKLEEETSLKRDFIIKTLKNPSIIVAYIQIAKLEDDNEDQFEEVQWELLNELECSCCFEYMLPPIRQCITGHSICSKCKESQSVCPTCTKDFKDTVNITLGKLIEHLTYPCKNEGCKFTCKAKDIEMHQANCPHSKFKCPLHDYENCNQEIPYVKLYDHILDSHYENLLEMDTISIPFKHYDEDESEAEEDENIAEDCFILRYDFRLFKLHYRYEGGMFLWEMQLIGTIVKDEKYEFEIDVKNNITKQRVCFRRECTTLSDKDEAFAGHRSFINIELNQIYDMIDEEFTYSVRILCNS